MARGRREGERFNRQARHAVHVVLAAALRAKTTSPEDSSLLSFLDDFKVVVGMRTNTCQLAAYCIRGANNLCIMIGQLRTDASGNSSKNTNPPARDPEQSKREEAKHQGHTIMAITEDPNQPKVQDGPRVHGRATIASIFSAKQLEASHFLTGLVKTINTAYTNSHTIKPELKMRSQGPRLGSTAEFLDALRDDSEGFVIIVSFLGSSEVISTATSRRYLGPAKENGSPFYVQNSPWYRQAEVEPDTEEWELKLMATDPEAQGQGLARFMMALGEREITMRFHAKTALLKGVEAEQHPKKLKMVLCTPRELTGEFYLRKGYTKDYEVWRGDGHNFHVVHMSRQITLSTMP